MLLAALCAAYLFKPDFAAALTIFPAWTWLPLGLLPALFRVWRDRKGALWLLGVWCCYGIAFSEEWTSLLRGSRNPESRLRYTTRIITLNCAGGSAEAANEVVRYRPDIVLLQESPSTDDVRKLAHRLFGSEGRVITGPDASIIAKDLKTIPLPRGTSDFVAGKISRNGQALTIVSLRLLPPVFRVDLFNPDAWRSLSENRKQRRTEIANIAAFIRKYGEGPTLVGGDFNCQSGDRALDAMPPDLEDSFYTSGHGWGHTAVNDYPLARIDQIWATRHFKPKEQSVVKTVYSDHRMVVCDLEPMF